MKWFRVILAGSTYSIMATSKRNAADIALAQHRQNLGNSSFSCIPRVIEVRNFQLGDKFPVSH